MERVKGIEPSYAAWEAAVLPLNYTRDRAVHITAKKEGQGSALDPLGPEAPDPHFV
jgi:hypothetical protein